MFAAPSPKKLTATRSSPRSLKPMAAPVAMGTLAPTMAFDGGGIDRHIGQVHLPALASRATGGLPPKLGGDLGGRTALGQKMAHGPVRAEHHVVAAQRAANADGHRFLALALMERSRHFALQEQLIQMVLESPDEHHLAKHFQHALETHGCISFVVGNNMAGFSKD